MKRKNLYISIFIIVILIISGVYYTSINKKIEPISKNQILQTSFDNKIILDDETLNNIELKDKDGNPVAAYIYLSNDNRSLMINPPIGGYADNEKYSLVINKKIHLENNTLKNKITKNFIVSSSKYEMPKKVFRKATIGDIIGVSGEFMGYKYDHYGIYIGNNKVIHYYGTNGRIEDTSIREDDLNRYFRNGNYFVLDVKPSSGISPEEVVKRAKSRLGENHYNLLQNNCEHFVVWCKTNEAKSYQVDKLSATELSRLKQLTALGLTLQ